MSHRVRRAGAWSGLGIVLVACAVLFAGRALAQGQAGSALDRAALLYDQSRFEEAIQAAKTVAADANAPATDVQRAKEWIARSQIKLGRHVEGRRTFVEMLRDDPQYRPDPNRVPPDEIEVFNAASRDFQGEQSTIGWPRGPSIAGLFGYGRYSNSDVNDSAGVKLGFNSNFELKHGLELGGNVRVPVRGRLSAQVDVVRLSMSDTDTSELKLTISSLPIILNAYYAVKTATKTRISAFAGAGPMLNTKWEVEIPAGLSVSSKKKTGLCVQGGLEGEYLFGRRYSLGARLFGRYAKASDVEFKPDPSSPGIDFDVDFNGIAGQLALRAYLGG